MRTTLTVRAIRWALGAGWDCLPKHPTGELTTAYAVKPTDAHHAMIRAFRAGWLAAKRPASNANEVHP